MSTTSSHLNSVGGGSGNDVEPPTTIAVPSTMSPTESSTNLTSTSAEVHVTDSMLSVYYQNVRGLRTKIAQLRLLLSSCEYDVLVFTETWLKADIASSEISPDYVIYRCDRNAHTSSCSRGGGVLVAVKNCLDCVSVPIAHCNELEQVAVRIKEQFRSLYIVAIYLPPNSNNQLYSAHAIAVQSIAERLLEPDIILSIGDFNLPYLRWSFDDDINGYIPSNATSDIELDFTNVMFAHGLRQINSFTNVNDRLLDLVFTNLPEFLDIIVPSSPLLPVDDHHAPFILLLDVRVVPTSTDESDECLKFDFSSCDFHLLNSVLAEIEWERVLNNDSVDQMLSNLNELIHDVFSRHIPRRRRVSSSVYNKPWWTPELRNLRNNLRKVRNRYFSSKNETDRARLRNLDLEYKSLLSETYKNYLLRIQATVKQDPSSFWSFVKKRKASSNIPGSVSYNETVSTTSSETANLFAAFFESVFSKASPVQRHDRFEEIPIHNINLPCIQFTPEEVRRGLEDLDPKKGPGTDNLPPAFLKNCASSLAKPITAVFNRSLSDRIFPTAWKSAYIVPIYKSGSYTCVENYRGVSILCTLSKVFEKLVHTVLYRAATPIISSSQHGFVKHRSTTSNLMCYVSALSLELESKQQVDSIYIDFAKAFDTVPHKLIVDKMDHTGFPSWITEWLYSYLSNRNAYVIVNSVRSRTFDIPSGVPQGSVLGPLMFIIFINDLCLLLSSSNLSFADDLKLFRVIVSPDDCAALQNDINHLLVWCGDNGMRVNCKKCKVISFSRCSNVLVHQYNMESVALERINSICDLGVTIDSKLRFHEHINIITAKAYTVLSFIRRHASEFTDIYCLKTLFCSLVRSILEYASPVWCPFQVTQSLAIERIQRKFVRFALRSLPWNDPVNLPCYADRCKLINLETLSSRRTKSQRLFVFDVLMGHVDCSKLLEQIPLNIPPRRFRNSPLLAIPYHRTNFGYNSSFDFCLRSFNVVCNEFDFLLTRNVFSARIRELV